MKLSKISVVAGAVLLLSAGCASVSNHKLGSPLKSAAGKVQINLESKGQIFASHKLAPKAKCATLKKAMTVSVRGEAGTPPVVMTMSCELIKNNLTFVSREMLRPGNYSVQITKGDGAKFLLDKPVVGARYEDPDFNSGADYMSDGAKDLPSGQVAKGYVSYGTGNATDWVKVSGKGAVALTLVDGSEEHDLIAQVFDLGRGARNPRFLGNLSHKKTRAFAAKGDKLYVRIKATPFTGEGNYSLIRGDSALGGAAAAGGGGGAKLSVIDCYQVSEDESVVLLEAGEALKAQDAVVVFGRAGQGGELVQLGDCEVTNVSGTQASCRMSGAVDSKYTEFRAVAKAKGAE